MDIRKVTQRDWLAERLLSTGSRPFVWGEVNLRTLGPLLRALLSTDGTVTKLLEAVMGEPIRVEVREQKRVALPEDHPDLEADRGASVLARDVVLFGMSTKRIYAEAGSLLVLDRVSVELADRLASHPQGIGRLLLESSLEMRRELLWYGRERGSSDPALVGRVCRAYRIISGGQPLALIVERFPRDLELTS